MRRRRDGGGAPQQDSRPCVRECARRPGPTAAATRPARSSRSQTRGWRRASAAGSGAGSRRRARCRRQGVQHCVVVQGQRGGGGLRGGRRWRDGGLRVVGRRGCSSRLLARRNDEAGGGCRSRRRCRAKGHRRLQRKRGAEQCGIPSCSHLPAHPLHILATPTASPPCLPPSP